MTLKKKLNHTIALLSLIIGTQANAQTLVDIFDTICDGENYEFGDAYYSQPGDYLDTTFYQNGSIDTLFWLRLATLPTHGTFKEQQICEGDSFYFDGKYLTTQGVYTEKLKNINGCDSINSLSLIVRSSKQDALKHAADSLVKTVMQNLPQINGLVFGVSSPLLGTYFGAYGYADPSTGKKMTVNAVFETGSIMKNHRWLLIHKLSSLGLVSIHDPINKYIKHPELNSKMEGITIADLMHHSSGLADHPNTSFFEVAIRKLNRAFGFMEMMDVLFLPYIGANDYGMIIKDGYVRGFSQKNDYNYSSFGPMIAGEIAAKITDVPITVLLDSLLFRPLNMNNTSYIGLDPKPVHLTPGYGTDGVLAYHQLVSLSSGFGWAHFSDVADLMNYTENQFTNEDYIPGDIANSMTSNTINGEQFDVGLGLMRYNDPNNPYGLYWGDFWGHLGSSFTGHSSSIAHRRSDSLSVVVLCNAHPNVSGFKPQFLITRIFGENLQEFVNLLMDQNFKLDSFCED